MLLGSRFLERVGLGVLIALAGSSPSLATGEPSLPAWLEAHVGEGEGQIAPVVLERARALYQRKGVRNPCYFAMDATRPHDLGGGGLGRRFYVICEAERSFRAVSAGHGGGRDLDGRRGLRQWQAVREELSNAVNSEPTAGGAYVTGETIASFKGYYRVAGDEAVFMRSFVRFDGEGETANSRERAIGGHPAVLLRGLCRRKDPASPSTTRRLRSVRNAGELRGRPQRRLHQLVAIGRPADHPDGEGRSDDALHLSEVPATSAPSRKRSQPARRRRAPGSIGTPRA